MLKKAGFKTIDSKLSRETLPFFSIFSFISVAEEELNLMILKNEILMDMLCEHTAEVHAMSQENTSLKLQFHSNKSRRLSSSTVSLKSSIPERTSTPKGIRHVCSAGDAIGPRGNATSTSLNPGTAGLERNKSGPSLFGVKKVPVKVTSRLRNSID